MFFKKKKGGGLILIYRSENGITLLESFLLGMLFTQTLKDCQCVHVLVTEHLPSFKF